MELNRHIICAEDLVPSSTADNYTLQINKTAFTPEKTKTSVWGRFFCMFVIKMEIFFVILSHFPIRDVYKGIFMEVKDGQKTL